MGEHEEKAEYISRKPNWDLGGQKPRGMDPRSSDDLPIIMKSKGKRPPMKKKKPMVEKNKKMKLSRRKPSLVSSIPSKNKALKKKLSMEAKEKKTPFVIRAEVSSSGKRSYSGSCPTNSLSSQESLDTYPQLPQYKHRSEMWEMREMRKKQEMNMFLMKKDVEDDSAERRLADTMQREAEIKRRMKEIQRNEEALRRREEAVKAKEEAERRRELERQAALKSKMSAANIIWDAYAHYSRRRKFMNWLNNAVQNRRYMENARRMRAEEQRREERRLEKERLAREAERLEKKRQQEAEIARLEEIRRAEERRLAEEKRIEEEKRLAEERRLAEEKRAQMERLRQEQQRKKEQLRAKWIVPNKKKIKLTRKKDPTKRFRSFLSGDNESDLVKSDALGLFSDILETVRMTRWKLTSEQLGKLVKQMVTFLPRYEKAFDEGRIDNDELVCCEKFSKALRKAFSDILNPEKANPMKKKLNIRIGAKRKRTAENPVHVEGEKPGAVDILGKSPAVVDIMAPKPAKRPRLKIKKITREKKDLTEDLKLCSDCLLYFESGYRKDATWLRYMEVCESSLRKIRALLERGSVTSAKQFFRLFLDELEGIKRSCEDTVRGSKARIATFLQHRFRKIFAYKVKILSPDYVPLKELEMKDDLLVLLDELWGKKEGEAFKFPVDPIYNDLKMYYMAVTEPMSLDDVRKKLNYHMYESVEDYKRDVLLVFDNALSYYNNTTAIGASLRTSAAKLKNLFLCKFEKLLEDFAKKKEEERQKKEEEAARKREEDIANGLLVAEVAVQEFEVECILAERITATQQKEYQVKWKGFDHSANTWEPVENLYKAHQALRDWMQSKEANEARELLESSAQETAQAVGLGLPPQQKSKTEDLKDNPEAQWSYDSEDEHHTIPSPIPPEVQEKVRNAAISKQNLFLKSDHEEMLEIIFGLKSPMEETVINIQKSSTPSKTVMVAHKNPIAFQRVRKEGQRYVFNRNRVAAFSLKKNT